MKKTIGNALLFLLAKLWPLEDIIGHAVKQAAKTKVAAEVALAVRAFDRSLARTLKAAMDLHAADVARHKARLAALDSVPHLVTPEGAAVLVATAANSATVTPQGIAQPISNPALTKAA